MASNKLPRDIDLLLTRAADGAEGALQYAEALGIRQNTQPAILADRIAAASAVKAVDLAEAGLRNAYLAAANADTDAAAFLAGAKGTLAPLLGTRYQPLHREAGFTPNSLALPRTAAGREQMLDQLRDFLTRHPQYADAREDVNVTVAGVTLKLQGLEQTRAAVNEASNVRGTAIKARDAAIQTLRKRLSCLIAELNRILSPTDDTWYSFGLTPPRNAVAPEALESELVVEQLGEGRLFLTWGKAKRATRYAVMVQRVGIDGVPIRVASVRERSFMLSDLTPGSVVKISVVGVNGAGAGPETVPVTVTVFAL